MAPLKAICRLIDRTAEAQRLPAMQILGQGWRGEATRLVWHYTIRLKFRRGLDSYRWASRPIVLGLAARDRRRADQALAQYYGAAVLAIEIYEVTPPPHVRGSWS
ncbi:MAG: hypothetical protein ACYTAN_06905 [Planctomycetota bacterium]|jgi:hypothetical protein